MTTTSSIAIAEIAASVRRLEMPSPALYRQAGQERRVEIRAVVEGAEAALHQNARDQLGAVARLQALDENPEPQTGNDFNYIDQIVGGKTNAARPPLGETRLTRQEIAEIEAKAEPHISAAAHLPWLSFRMALQGVLLALIAGVDVALLASTFSYLTGGAVFMTAVLSTAGLLVTAAFHLSTSKESRDA